MDSATPHPDPSGGQAPRLAKSSTALHFLIPPSTIGLQFGTFRRRRAGTEGDWRAHPGSESGTCFHSNRTCRLAPAHQGMKIRSCDLVWGVGTVDSATPHPDPSGGQAPALHFLIPPSDMGLQFGTPRFEEPELWLGTASWHGGFCHAPPRPQRGTSPRTTFSHSARPSDMGLQFGTPRFEEPELWLGTASWHGDSATPHPDPSGGQAPALHFLIPPSDMGLQFGTPRY